MIIYFYVQYYISKADALLYISTKVYVKDVYWKFIQNAPQHFFFIHFKVHMTNRISFIAAFIFEAICCNMPF